MKNKMKNLKKYAQEVAWYDDIFQELADTYKFNDAYGKDYDIAYNKLWQYANRYKYRNVRELIWQYRENY